MNGAILRARSHSADHDFGNVLEHLWRRKWIPLLGFAAGLALGLAALLLSPPLYRASAQIMFDNAGNASTLSNLNASGALQSEVEIMESTPVLSKVAGTLGLYRDARFRRAGIAEMLIVGGDDENALRERVLGRLDHMVRVGVVPGTGIIDITARHPNPDRAAQIANAVLAAYQERKVDERFEQSRQIGGWMSKRLEEIKAQAEAAKKQLQDFQARNGLIALGGADMKARRLEVLNQNLAETQGEIAALTTRLDEAKKNRKGRGAQSLSGVLESDRILALKKTETQLATELADMQQRYGERHPKIIAQKAELARVRAEIGVETRNVVDSIAQDLAIAQGRLASLQSQINDVSAHYDVDGRLKLQLRDLEAEVAAAERLYADFLMKYQDMMAQTELRVTDMKVISMATIPSAPDQHERIAIVMVLGVVGFFVGLACALFRILWARGFTSVNQLEGMTGYPVFAHVPAAGGKGAVHHNVTQDPAAILAESLRSLRVALRLRGEVGKRTRVVAFTSTLPDEGKTSLAVMLAMIASKSGERVCVVDCDLRRPSLHKAFGIGNARGLADYLSDRLGLDDVIYRKDPSGVHLVTAKAVPSYSLTLLTSGRMESLIANLREQYDLVILDAPSSLAFADARVLARMVDQTLYVVAWNRTRRESVVASLKAYADMHYADLALVLNKVDLEEYLRDSAAAVLYQYGQEQAPAFAA